MLQIRTAVALALTLALAACGGPDGATERGRARPHFEPGFNLFSPQQDVELGRESARQIASQMKLVVDPAISGFLDDLGRRLASHAPGEKFPYEFHVLDAAEINAFALPGGFVFVNRGTLDAVEDEGELAGVVAHEIAHIALRHGTNQVSKAYVAQAGIGILDSITGGGDGTSAARDIIAAVGGLGLNAVFLKFGRTAETQADLTGVTIMADAGYDPSDMADFFETMRKRQGDRLPPEFLSDHPDPGNRIASIERVKPSLDVSPNPIGVTDAFRAMKQRLRALPPAATAEVRKIGSAGPGAGGERPQPPSETFRPFESPTGAYALEYPASWEALGDGSDTAAFAPEGGFGKLDDDVVFTHGVLVGIADAGSADLREAAGHFIEAQLRANPDFRVVSRPKEVSLAGLPALATILAGPSPVSDRPEADVVYTALLPDGRMLYAITVAPEDEYQSYMAAFDRTLRSIRLG